VLRPVSSDDAITADWSRVPHEVLARISTRITNEVHEVNRVVLDIKTKAVRAFQRASGTRVARSTSAAFLQASEGPPTAVSVASDEPVAQVATPALPRSPRPNGPRVSPLVVVSTLRSRPSRRAPHNCRQDGGHRARAGRDGVGWRGPSADLLAPVFQ